MAGAKSAGYTIVRLNGAIVPLFKNWLSLTFPDRAQKVWNLISDCHGGDVSDSRFSIRMKGEGNIADMIFQQFNLVGRASVLSNVLMGSLSRVGTLKSLMGILLKQEKEKALHYLGLVGIKDKAYMGAAQLSGGQDQRCAIARA